MKVAYNNCFGGFSLSHLATVEYAKRKGITLTAYEQTKYRHEGGVEEYVRVIHPSRICTHYLTEDLGDVISELPNDLSYYESFYGEDTRCDKDLINIIEVWGKEANGICADLVIEEIPDGVDFEITEYDGNESVVPPRMSW
tara:strand:+ start:493 stop:915 length:423 start_codon:yes stop_codon:yes gene_type:complete